MVCAKCQKISTTPLATPGVKRKNEMYYGSPAKKEERASATLGHNGVGKSKLLSKSAKNPYAAYSSSCETCKTKVDQGRKYCHRCAYKANGMAWHSQDEASEADFILACAMCGKRDKAKTGAAAPLVEGQKFSAK
ncbi:MAG: hypothetical protein M1824_003785 [Vezdaea acicularis]|nr:MAG: hypothetical protein M1824_003785 [Vezdaea acicularis]